MLIYLCFLVPPKFVSIEGAGLVKAGSSVTLSCTTDNSNPRAIINWYSKGLLINPDGDSKVRQLIPL